MDSSLFNTSEYLLLVSPLSHLLNIVGAYKESMRHEGIYHFLRNKFWKKRARRKMRAFDTINYNM